MSDDEMDYGMSEDEEEEEEEADIENQYYNAKGCLEEDEDEGGGIDKAIEGFKSVIDMEKEKGEWGFKAYKMQVKLYLRLGEREKLMEAYKNMLTYVNEGAVTKNYSEKVVTNLLELVATSKDTKLLEEFFNTTLEALKRASNHRLWFRTNMKLCNLYLDTKDFNRLQPVVKQLHDSCKTPNGEDDPQKGTQLLEVYSVQISMYTEQQDTKKLKELYEKALAIKSAIPHPRVMGIIRECGGKMHMGQFEWNEAATDFFEAFKSYDEAGESRKMQCLKYLALASMLAETDVDPFGAQETKAYRDDPEVQAMTSLVSAYQASDVQSFERLLRSHNEAFMQDPFIRPYVRDVLRKIRTHVLLNLVKPYSHISLSFAASELSVSTNEVEHLLLSLILDGRICGSIDQVDGVLILEEAHPREEEFEAIERWATELKKFSSSVAMKVS